MIGVGALPARPCRNHTRARAESVHVVTRKIVIELYPSKVKPEETLIEVGSDSDV